MKFDNPIKEILQDAMPALLRLLGLPEAVKYLTVELPRPNRVVPDMVIELASQAILHLESQSRNQADFAWRCLDYYSAIHQLFHPPKIIQVLVYLGSERLSMPNRINDEDLTFKYRVLNLAEVPAEVFLDSPSNLERILAVLGRSEDPRETIRQILSGWKHLPRKQIEELMARLSVLSQLRKYDTIAREEIERMPVEIDITENAFYKAGEARGEAMALLRVIEKRFGGNAVSGTARERVLGASKGDLDRWLDRAVSAASIDDVFQS